MAVSIAGAGIFAVALLSGLLLEQTQRGRGRDLYPQIGRSVDIGGRTLNINCSGAGQPAVILESGQLAGQLDGSGSQDDLRQWRPAPRL